MPRSPRAPGSRAGVTALVRDRIERGGERLWRHEDFSDLSFAAVAQALSRLTRVGVVQRLSKGVYYRSRETAFGKSMPNPRALGELAERRQRIHPAGIAAAAALGLTTQVAKRREVATSARSLPRKLVGSDTVVHLNRPAARAQLGPEEAALLEVLRDRARESELSADQTVRRLKRWLSTGDHLQRLLRVAFSEPPRVRAMLGALAESVSADAKALRKLRATLNPLSRFDFGALAVLPNARAWQAKAQRKP
jgi:hypothetical protein